MKAFILNYHTNLEGDDTNSSIHQLLFVYLIKMTKVENKKGTDNNAATADGKVQKKVGKRRFNRGQSRSRRPKQTSREKNLYRRAKMKRPYDRMMTVVGSGDGEGDGDGDGDDG